MFQVTQLSHCYQITNRLEFLFDLISYEKSIQYFEPKVQLTQNLDKLQKKFKDTKWISVVHADGNGLGEIFLNFDRYLNYEKTEDGGFNYEKNGRKYVESYRRFSIALEICTLKATATALRNLLDSWQKNNKDSSSEIPVIPIVLGGDDLTLLCDGEYALKFTKDFLAEFEKETSNNEIIKIITKNAFNVERLGICAGIAIIKPHYPFHQAYDLAENLIKSAKQVKTKIKHNYNNEDVSLPCSAMDFHVLYDSSGVELNQICERLEVEGGETYLFAKPYIVTCKDKLKEKLKLENKKFTNEWLENRTWDKLETRVCAMLATENEDEGKRQLPNSMLHHIRESLFRGQKETDSEVNLFSHRYKAKGFNNLLWKKEAPHQSLFFSEDGKNYTHFLDALDVVEFWKGFDCKENATAKNDENGGVE
ncbi:MAG: Cas10/Cmr2 second palm domain-containing protein [Pyrinomonadaceae bacterium]